MSESGREVTEPCNSAEEAMQRKLEMATQELKNIANADTVEWDDPSQYEAWAKSRARHTLAALKDKS